LTNEPKAACKAEKPKAETNMMHVKAVDKEMFKNN
jgi:hypothetical protein